MIAKQKRLIKQSNIPFGRCVAVSVLTSVVSNALAFVHAGLAVANLFLASVLCAICFKRAGLKRFRRPALTAYLILMVVFALLWGGRQADRGYSESGQEDGKAFLCLRFAVSRGDSLHQWRNHKYWVELARRIITGWHLNYQRNLNK